MASNWKNTEIGRLRELCLDDSKDLEKQWSAAKALIKLGLGERSLPCIRRVITKMEGLGDPATVRRPDQLKAKLEEALIAKQASAEEKAAPAASTAVAPSTSPEEAITSTEVAGLDLLPDPNNAEAWSRVGPIDHDNNYPKPISVAELLAKIDIPLWTGEIETVNRKPVNLRKPSTLGLRFEDWELDWNLTLALECSHDRAERALYKAESTARVHARLQELGIKCDAGVFVPLEELAAQLTAASAKLQPPFVTFKKVEVDNVYGTQVRKAGPDTHTIIRLDLTESGRQRRFANLCLSRIRHGLNIYGRAAAAAGASNERN
jgi:hypothetical protein